jgi:hypothetical protein
MKKLFLIALIVSLVFGANAQTSKDTSDVDKLRTESGVDPTRVASRVGYSVLLQDQPGTKGTVTNRVVLNIGVGRWAFQVKTEAVSKTPAEAGQGFQSGFGDIKINFLNAFFVKGKSAFAANAEFSLPTGGSNFGSEYFSITPALTYSYTIDPSLIFAIQPQYTLDILKDPAYPDLSVITVRAFLAKFTRTGYFMVLEPRPIFDLTNRHTDFVISPIIGKSLGKGFNLIFLSELALTKNIRNSRGHIFQIGVNKNF